MKRTFSILSLLLLLAIAGLGFAFYQSQQKVARVQQQLDESRKFENYLKGELGYLEPSEDARFYLRELENQIPLARKYALRFPYGKYRLCAGNYLGGEFHPQNLQRHNYCELRLSMTHTMEIHISKNPSDEAEFSAHLVCYNSGASSGAKIKHVVDINALNYSDDQHRRAAEWRIQNKRPHGDLQVFDETSNFVPLFILKDGVTLNDKNGQPKECKGLAFWFERDVEEVE